ncbi:MAG: response regulator transcription factor [Leptospiraceae bacterium]|nr:response regulator transcription factor [Leptospiraceae bacterium]MDW8306041.1 response regulator transcription factor [Leptospiraceae bacterium]
MKRNELRKKKARIALVEDHDDIRELLQLQLINANYEVDAFFSAEQLLKSFERGKYDLLILDVMLPGKNGISLAQEILQKYAQVPILFISALRQSDKISEAYKLGAVDYIVKPLEIEILLLKIRNLLEHFKPQQSAEKNFQKVGRGLIFWDLLQVKRDDEYYLLSPREAGVLKFFLKNKGRIITRQEILDQVWGDAPLVSGRNIDNYVVKFRKLFEEDPAHPQIFITYPRRGYACFLPETD